MIKITLPARGIMEFTENSPPMDVAKSIGERCFARNVIPENFNGMTYETLTLLTTDASFLSSRRPYSIPQNNSPFIRS
jgi:threonyl-tRNA synthetase